MEAVTRPLLTIAVPTWERADHLDRLLASLVPQLDAAAPHGGASILVLDNASSDRTPAVCARYSGVVTTVRQPRHVGFDRNVLACYDRAASEYVLFFGDDDVPDGTLVEEVAGLLRKHVPAVLTYSFRQPPHTDDRPTIDVAAPYIVSTTPSQAVPFLTRFLKLSTYCVAKRSWNPADRAALESKIGTNYLFASLALLTFLREPERGCLLYRGALAGCSDGYNRNVRFEPGFFADRAAALAIGGPDCGGVLLDHASSDADRIRITLNDLTAHYRGDMTFAPEALEQAERTIWTRPRDLMEATTLPALVEYLAAKHIARPALRSWVLSVADPLRSIARLCRF